MVIDDIVHDIGDRVSTTNWSIRSPGSPGHLLQRVLITDPVACLSRATGPRPLLIHPVPPDAPPDLTPDGVPPPLNLTVAAARAGNPELPFGQQPLRWRERAPARRSSPRRGNEDVPNSVELR
jgi:hypothetical protein